MAWQPVPINTKLFLNVDEEVLTKGLSALENAFVNESGGHTRFPGLTEWVNFGGSARVYTYWWRMDLIAVTTDGKVYRIDKSGAFEDVTGVPVSINAGYRPVFAQTDSELLITAGGQIIRFAGGKTEVLSDDAPLASFVGFIDNYVIAVETDSGRFYHSEAGAYRTWSSLDVFTASGKPDDINGLIITDYRELLLTGRESIEQFERLRSGTTPFFRRWAVGEGVLAPYTLTLADNATWCVNKDKEFIRFSGQISQPASDDIGKALTDISDWTDAWSAKINIIGQKFLLLCVPNATSPYDGDGMTYIYDYRQQKWSTLYGWDGPAGVPGRWPGWSYMYLWGEHFVGGEGVIYKLDASAFNTSGAVQRFYGRTAHLTAGNSRVDNVRVRLKRGVGSYESDPVFKLRCRRDGKKLSRWVQKGLGKTGDRFMNPEFGGFGAGHTFQWEWMVSDDCDVELISIEANMTQMR